MDVEVETGCGIVPYVYRERAGPARALGLARKGHLAPGADADVVVYPKRLDDVEWMFDHPVYVIKDGEVVVREREILAAPNGRTFAVRAPYADTLVPALREYFEKYYTVQFDNYVYADPHDVTRSEVVPLAEAS
jgi:formylmethanofuran dehydrogenase subunit A